MNYINLNLPKTFMPEAPEKWRQWYWNEGSRGLLPGEDVEEMVIRKTLEVWGLATGEKFEIIKRGSK